MTSGHILQITPLKVGYSYVTNYYRLNKQQSHSSTFFSVIVKQSKNSGFGNMSKQLASNFQSTAAQSWFGH